ncbi:MAG: hypothetical protein QXO40_02350 [Candidatus Aenigmatarchaeota archaeon]
MQGNILFNNNNNNLLSQSGFSEEYDVIVNFTNASLNFIKVTITDLDKVKATTIQVYVEVINPLFNGDFYSYTGYYKFEYFSVVHSFI